MPGSSGVVGEEFPLKIVQHRGAAGKLFSSYPFDLAKYAFGEGWRDLSEADSSLTGD